MNNIQVFNSPEFGEIRSIIIDNQPWFVGKDVAKTLGYAETANMRKLLDKYDYMEIDPQKPEFSGFVQNGSVSSSAHRMLLVNESGIYTAIFGSTLPKAKQFKRWVTHDVLPSIRKTGSFSTDDTERLDQHIITLAQGHVALRNDVNTLKQEMHDLKDDLPIFPAEAEKITLAVKRKGVEVMGGKKSPAYRDRSLVQSIYHDIYGEIHRQFGITSYKMLRRKDVDSAVSVVSEYSLPIILVERVKDANAQTTL